MKPFVKLREESNRTGADFLRIEVETAFTFLAVADTTSSEESRSRNRENALVAYNTILRLAPRVTLLAEQKSDLETGVEALRKRLAELGFSV